MTIITVTVYTVTVGSMRDPSYPNTNDPRYSLSSDRGKSPESVPEGFLHCRHI